MAAAGSGFFPIGLDRQGIGVDRVPSRGVTSAGSKRRGKLYALLADEELVSLVEQGDAEAFAMLYDRHSRPAYSLAYRMMGEKQAAEDLLQDALLKVWRAASRYGRHWAPCLRSS
jgi:DNA-directed RNA polymerase specialized sigma24 family protein